MKTIVVTLIDARKLVVMTAPSRHTICVSALVVALPALFADNLVFIMIVGYIIAKQKNMEIFILA